MKADKQHSALEVIKKEQLKRRVFSVEFKAEEMRYKKAENLSLSECFENSKCVTAASNSISFRRLCRSAIDHSTNTGQCAIGRLVNLESAGTGSGPSTLFIDDARYNIDAAQALGWTGIRFDNSAQVRQDLLLMGAL